MKKAATNAASRGSSQMATILQSAVCRTRVMHRPAPSLFYFPGLSSQPIFPSNMFPWTKRLENSVDDILEEYKTLRRVTEETSDYAQQNEEHKLHSGRWDWNSYVLKGKRQAAFAVHCPNTVELLESIDSAGSLMIGTPFSFAFFSTLHPKSTIDAHHGPCNLRLRCHFPLIVPKSSDDDGSSAAAPASYSGVVETGCGMEVGGVKVQWQVGKPLIFDDCYQHKVWNATQEERVLLLFDIWHPELHADEIAAIQDMFQDAQSKGWLS